MLNAHSWVMRHLFALPALQLFFLRLLACFVYFCLCVVMGVPFPGIIWLWTRISLHSLCPSDDLIIHHAKNILLGDRFRMKTRRSSFARHEAVWIRLLLLHPPPLRSTVVHVFVQIVLYIPEENTIMSRHEGNLKNDISLFEAFNFSRANLFILFSAQIHNNY